MTTPVTPDDLARAEAFFKDDSCVVSSEGLAVGVDYNTALLAQHFAAAREAVVREWSEAWATAREAILSGRGPLAEMVVDSDVVHAVLGILDDNQPQNPKAAP